MMETVKDSYMQGIYTTGRHYNVKILFSPPLLARLFFPWFQILGAISVWHNIFPKGPNSRLIALNCTGYVLMRSPRIGSQVPTLGSQLGIRKKMTKAYKMATENRPYSALVVDFTNRSDGNAWMYSLRSNVFPDDLGHTVVYGTPSKLEL